MTYIPNSIEARDVASLVHMQTNLRTHQQEGPHVIVRGEGCRVFDDSGRDYIDAVAGLWCASLGFGSERLAKVAYEQMRNLGYYHLYRHRSNEPAIALAETLLELAPVPMARVVFQCSGSEANDTAIKLAWYYWNAVGKPQRTKLIARSMAYHGSTCAAVSLSGKPDMHAGFGLPFAPFKHTEFPHYYRRHEPGETQEEFSARMAEALETLIQAEGADTIAAFFAEPVMGAGGAILPPRGYFEKIQAVLRKYDILFVADEVICGFARTGEMWGCQTFGIRPDMVTSAKALSAAMQPISAVLVSERIHAAMLAQSDRFGNFAHGFTYAGHPVAAAVALEVQKIYAEIDIVGRAKRLGAVLQSALGRLTPAVQRALQDAGNRRDKRQSEHALREANRRLHALSSRMLEIQEQERRSLARELHDEIGQVLTAVKIDLQTQLLRGPGGDGIESSIRLVDGALERVRSLSLDLRPSQLDDLGLEPALRALPVAARACLAHRRRALSRRAWSAW